MCHQRQRTGQEESIEGFELTGEDARYFHATGVHVMPTTGAEWQAAIVKIYGYHLNGKPGKSSLKTRLSEWQGGIKPLLDFLRDIASLIPKRVRVQPK